MTQVVPRGCSDFNSCNSLTQGDCPIDIDEAVTHNLLLPTDASMVGVSIIWLGDAAVPYFPPKNCLNIKLLLIKF